MEMFYIFVAFACYALAASLGIQLLGICGLLRRKDRDS